MNTKYVRSITFAAFTTALVLGSDLGITAQQARTQAQRQAQQAQQAAMHQQTAQMQQMMQRVDQITTRAQRLSQTFAQQTARGQGQARQQSQLFQQMCDSVTVAARETRQNMDRIQQMLQDPALTHDRNLQRDLDRLREHVATMTTSMEDALNTMDQVQQRLQARTPQ